MSGPGARAWWPAGVAAAAFALAVGLPARDPDMWWHLASGRWMVEHLDLLRVDVFSSTATGDPYALGEPLGQVVLYAAYALGSWTGVAVLRAALVAVAAFFLVRAALRFARPAVAVPLVAAALVLSSSTWGDRPQLFTLALFPVALELLLAARDGARRALVVLVAVIAVWSVLHAGYALAVGVLAAFMAVGAIERRHGGAFAAALLAAVVVSGVAPGALSLARAVDHVAGATIGIVEESPADVLTPFGAAFAAFVGLTVLVLLARGGSQLSVAVVVPLLWLALSAQRHIPYFGFAVAVLLAGPVESALADAGRVLRGRVLPVPGIRLPRLAPLLVAALWLGALASVATAPTRPDERAYPTGAAQALRGSSGILLNEYDWGGWLIWNVPDRPVFVDGRLFPYLLNETLFDYRRAIAVLPAWRDVLTRWSVRHVLVRPHRAIADALKDDGWTVVAEDPTFVLLERPR